ncbi:MAG: NAD(P)/FAD-dependent oxidoreductase [Deltaproteobacteria bacterium]|nr:MAG: NAD(P)/FAD-dependent oxidoreductase [Deltaproteobacteria bacterium]
MVFQCDILVVGAGPAGSSAAAAAAENGVHVLVAERKDVLGVPVRCAEYIPRQLLGQLETDRDFVVQFTRGMRTFLPTGRVKEILAPGLMINRQRFDQALAQKAACAGSNVLTGTRVIGRKEGTVFLKGTDKRVRRVKPKVIIGADGPFSLVGKWMGRRNRHLIPAIQVSATLARSMEWTHVYFDSHIYGGYGWLFPKGKEANVGLGISRGSIWSQPLKTTLARFVHRLEKDGLIRETSWRMTAGWVPAEPVRDVSRGAMLLAGDAAGQTHPLTGAGIAHAVLCGRMAGKWAARAVQANDIALLKEYDREWQDDLGEQLQRAFRKRENLEKEWDRLEEILPSCWVGFREYYAEP